MQQLLGSQDFMTDMRVSQSLEPDPVRQSYCSLYDDRIMGGGKGGGKGGKGGKKRLVTELHTASSL